MRGPHLIAGGLALALTGLAIAVVADVGALARGGVPDGPGESVPEPGPLRVAAGPAFARMDERTRLRVAGDVPAATAWLAARRQFRGRWATGRLAWRGEDATTLAAAAAGSAPTVSLAPVVREIGLSLPAVRQVFRNNCETAALSMALRGRVDQERLQRLLPISAPLDPVDGPQGRVWGDPQQGFVGRVEGGGFGVFERPLARLGRQFDSGTRVVRMRDFDAVLDLVRAGKPVVVWVALGPSAPLPWTTQEGRGVRADQAQHTVVLAGLDTRGVTVHDPWTGRVTSESVSSLANRWKVLGRRTLATSARPAPLVRSGAS